MIPDLPSLYVDHLVAPRGQEDLPEAEAEGQRGSMVGGMGVRVTLNYREGHHQEALIRAASVRVFGSAAPLAPASYLSEYVVGLPPDAAQEIQPLDLIHALAGRNGIELPEVVHKGAAFAVDALHCALGLPGCRPADPEGDGILVCRCLGVGDRRIRQAIASGADTPEAIGESCRACTGCRSCRSDILAILREEQDPSSYAPPRDRHPVTRITLARVGPVLQAHGLPLCDAHVTDDAVVLRLGEAEREDAISPRGAQAVARHLLRETVWDGIRVELDD